MKKVENNILGRGSTLSKSLEAGGSFSMQDPEEGLGCRCYRERGTGAEEGTRVLLRYIIGYTEHI